MSPPTEKWSPSPVRMTPERSRRTRPPHRRLQALEQRPVEGIALPRPRERDPGDGWGGTVLMKWGHPISFKAIDAARGDGSVHKQVMKSRAARVRRRAGESIELPRKSREASTWKDAVLSRDKQFAAKRSVLIREAARAFGQKGYHNASLDDVAQQLGVTKPALYYYVKSKQEILFECHMISSDVADRAVAYADEVQGTGLDRVVALCRRYLESLISESARSPSSPSLMP